MASARVKERRIEFQRKREGVVHEGGEQMMTLIASHLGESHRSGDTMEVRYRIPMAIHEISF